MKMRYLYQQDSYSGNNSFGTKNFPLKINGEFPGQHWRYLTERININGYVKEKWFWLFIANI